MVGESGKLVCSARRAVGPALRHRSSIVAEHATIRRGDAGSTPAGVTKAQRCSAISISSSPSLVGIAGSYSMVRRYRPAAGGESHSLLDDAGAVAPCLTNGEGGRAGARLHARGNWARCLLLMRQAERESPSPLDSATDTTLPAQACERFAGNLETVADLFGYGCRVGRQSYSKDLT